jgi:serine/threonine protein kinase
MEPRVLANRYEMVESLGAGAMATVWRARDSRLGREVAIKVLSEQLASTAAFRERFEREAMHVAALQHPNIVTVFDSGTEDGSYYIIMELVNGQSLERRLQLTSPYGVAETQRLAGEVLAGLAHAHGKGIIHRDIKPANILVTSEGTAKLADFGIARTTSDVHSLTATGSFLGTPYYASPEQLEGRPVSAATDLYSLSCALYRCLAGHPPFEAEIPMGVVVQHLQAAPRSLRQQRPEIPPQLEATVLRALEKDPARRFGSAEEMSRSLAASGVARNGVEEGLSTVVKDPHVREARLEPVADAMEPSAYPAAERRPPNRRRRRRIVIAVGATAAIIALGVALPLVLLGGGGASPPPAPTTTKALMYLMADGLEGCTSPAPTFTGMTGVTVSASCANNKDLPGTATTGYTFHSPSDLQTSFRAYEQQIGLSSFQSTNCPPPVGTTSGRTTWTDSHYPGNSSQQILDCAFVPVNGTQRPTYIWKIPQDQTFVVAIAGPNATMEQLDYWYSNYTFTQS